MMMMKLEERREREREREKEDCLDPSTLNSPRRAPTFRSLSFREILYYSLLFITNSVLYAVYIPSIL